MNTGKPENPGGSDFDQDLNEVESQYRTVYTDEPPAMLDQAILNKARRAAEVHSIRPWNFGWMHASATAALLVLGLTLVLQQRSEVSVPPPMFDRLERNQPITAPVNRDSSVLNQEMAAEPVDQDFSNLTLDTTRGVVERRENADDSLMELSGRVQENLQLQDRLNEELKNAQQQSAARSRQMSIPEQESPVPVADFRSVATETAPDGDYRHDEAAGSADPIVTMSASSTMSKIQKTAAVHESDWPALGASLAASAEETQLDAESWVELILELKLAAESDNQDDAIDWQAELELFLETYPDYPLPEVLADAAKRIVEAAGGE